MKKILPLFLVIVSTFAFAQYEKFDLRTFKLPELKTQYLNIQFNGDGYLRKYVDYSNSTVDKYDDLQNEVSLRYGQYKSNKKLQREIDISFDFEYQYHREIDEDDDRMTNNFYSDFLIKGQERRFISPKTFIEADYTIDLSNRTYNSRVYSFEDSVSNSSKENYKNHLIYIPLKVGRGRIERVDDARRAIYILDALSRNNRLSKELTDKEITDLSERISILRERRVYDQRISDMQILEELDLYLQSQGYVTDADAPYFVNLYDMWKYGYNIKRYHGKRISLAVQPGLEVYYNDHYWTNLSFWEYNTPTLDIGINYNQQNAASLNNQQRLNAFVYSGVYRETYDGEIANVCNYRIGAEYVEGYYPNSRTDYSLSLGLYYANIGAYDQSTAPVSLGAIFEGRFNGTINYYISPKLRVSGYAQLKYYYQKSSIRLYADFDQQISSMYKAYWYSSLGGYDRSEFRFEYGIRFEYIIF